MTTDSTIYTRRFWADTVERVVRTTAQVALVVFGVPAGVDATSVSASLGGLTAVDWQGKLIVVAGSAVMTLLTCLAGRRTGDTSTASLTRGTV